MPPVTSNGVLTEYELYIGGVPEPTGVASEDDRVYLERFPVSDLHAPSLGCVASQHISHED